MTEPRRTIRCCGAQPCCPPPRDGASVQSSGSPPSDIRCHFGVDNDEAWDLVVDAEWDPEGSVFVCQVDESAAKVATFCKVVSGTDNVLCNTFLSTGEARTPFTATTDLAVKEPSALGIFKDLSFLDRWLAVWILLAMGIGLLLGYYVDGIQETWGRLEIAGVSLPLALGLWLMMWPVLTKVQYELLGKIFKHKAFNRLLATSIVLNWVVGPALMTGLAWATLPDLPEYRTGVILVGIARCIAMVLIWNDLAAGDAELCAILVAVNSVMQIVLYAPLAIFYLQVVSRGSGVSVSFWEVARSVLLFLGVPLVAGVVTRFALIKLAGRQWFEKRFLRYFGPLALLGLLWTILVMFSSQAKEIIDDIGNVARVAVPMLLYFGIMFFGSLFISSRQSIPYMQSVTQAFTAAGNNFELAIAIAVGTFGILSKEALAATVGPLIEVPVLLVLVYVALWMGRKGWIGGGRAAMTMADMAGTSGTKPGADKTPAPLCGNKYGGAPAGGGQAPDAVAVSDRAA